MTARIRTRIGLALVAVSVASATLLYAQTRIRLGTIAPDNTIWAKTAREMGESWKKRTSGRVTSIVNAGTVGSEESMLKDMRISKRLHAAQLSAITLGHLDKAFNVFGIPLFFESYDEVDRVLDALGPTLDQRLEAKGLNRLNWGFAGWVHVFSKSPVKSVDDLKRLKLYTSAGDDQMASWYRDNGFNPVALDPTQMMPSLTTGMIEAIPATPLSAQLFQWYEHTGHMMDLGFAPLIGATVMAADVWARIPAADQQILIEEAKKAEARLRSDVPRLDREAIAQMQKSGKLSISKGVEAEWRKAADQFGKAMSGKLVPDDVYDVARRTRDEYRRSRQSKQ
ncbi:MAG TPA: TRAP transporter substrate-binding protein DctP [Vicinamibacterales bacterium]|nr:TRAP transporter substrate-binding protein DctP [Vicinamibacterales bacterium]